MYEVYCLGPGTKKKRSMQGTLIYQIRIDGNEEGKYEYDRQNIMGKKRIMDCQSRNKESFTMQNAKNKMKFT